MPILPKFFNLSLSDGFHGHILFAPRRSGATIAGRSPTQRAVRQHRKPAYLTYAGWW